MEQDPQRVLAMLLGLERVRVLGVGEDEEGLVVEVETELGTAGCPQCGGVARLDGSEELERSAPDAFGRPVMLIWKLRRFRCENASCPVESFLEDAPAVSEA